MRHLVLAAVLAACGEPRPLASSERHCASWREDVAAPVATACASCHGGDAPAAGYDVTTYLGAIARDIRSAPAGVPGHEALAELRPLLDEWVVECELAYFRSPIHPGGIMNPADPDDFHGAFVRELGWAFDVCASCHGADFAGGAAQVSCRTCHEDGPTACTTCHGQPPATGSHAEHMAGATLAHPVACAECHVVPVAWDDPGHILDGAGARDDAPPEVTFGDLAGALASWDGTRCSGVACHGGAFTDTNAGNNTPVWAEPGTGQADCGTCHGLPPSSHAQDQCDSCHPRVAMGTMLTDFVRHLDGTVSLGDESGTCTACHGAEVTGVGAHASHLTAPHRVRGPLTCADCHAVPMEVTSPGHIDSVAPVELAITSWDVATGTCSGDACHGQATTVWSPVGFGQAGCGTCHDIPPADVNHTPGMVLSDCAACHPSTVDAFGNILLTGPAGMETSTHVNGVPDAP